MKVVIQNNKRHKLATACAITCFVLSILALTLLIIFNTAPLDLRLFYNPRSVQILSFQFTHYGIWWNYYQEVISLNPLGWILMILTLVCIVLYSIFIIFQRSYISSKWTIVLTSFVSLLIIALISTAIITYFQFPTTTLTPL